MNWVSEWVTEWLTPVIEWRVQNWRRNRERIILGAIYSHAKGWQWFGDCSQLCTRQHWLVKYETNCISRIVFFRQSKWRHIEWMILRLRQAPTPESVQTPNNTNQGASECSDRDKNESLPCTHTHTHTHIHMDEFKLPKLTPMERIIELNKLRSSTITPIHTWQWYGWEAGTKNWIRKLFEPNRIKNGIKTKWKHNHKSNCNDIYIWFNICTKGMIGKIQNFKSRIIKVIISVSHRHRQ